MFTTVGTTPSTVCVRLGSSDQDDIVEYVCPVEDVKVELPWNQHAVTPLSNTQCTNETCASIVDKTVMSQIEEQYGNEQHTGTTEHSRPIVDRSNEREESNGTSNVSSRTSVPTRERISSRPKQPVVILSEINHLSQFQKELKVRQHGQDGTEREIVKQREAFTLGKTEMGNINTCIEKRPVGRPRKRHFTSIKGVSSALRRPVGSPRKKILAAFRLYKNYSGLQQRNKEANRNTLDFGEPEKIPDTVEPGSVGQINGREYDTNNTGEEAQTSKDPREDSSEVLPSSTGGKPKRSVGRPRKKSVCSISNIVGEPENIPDTVEPGSIGQISGREYDTNNTGEEAQASKDPREDSSEVLPSSTEGKPKRSVGRPRKKSVCSISNIVGEPENIPDTVEPGSIGQISGREYDTNNTGEEAQASKDPREDSSEVLPSSTEGKPKRSVGRPRKKSVCSISNITNVAEETAVSGTEEARLLEDLNNDTDGNKKRPVGRPRKSTVEAMCNSYSPSQMQNKGYALRKLGGDAQKSEEARKVITEEKPKRPVGRPRKKSVCSLANKVNDVEETVVSPVTEAKRLVVSGEEFVRSNSEVKPRRPVGRPRRNPFIVEPDVSILEQRNVEGMAAAGRSDKVSTSGGINGDNSNVTPVKTEKSHKRPVGRPRKKHTVMKSYAEHPKPSNEGERVVGDLDGTAQESEGTNKYYSDVHRSTEARTVQRGRPGVLDTLDEDKKWEIAQYCLKHGATKTAFDYTEKLGKLISNQSVWRLMRYYLDRNKLGESEEINLQRRKIVPRPARRLTLDQKRQIAKYAIKYGNAQAAVYFSRVFGLPIPQGTVRNIKNRYQQTKDPMGQSGEICRFGGNNVKGTAEKCNTRKPYKSKYTEEQRRDIAEYSIKHGNAEAATHFSQVLNRTVPINTVLTLKAIYRKKRRMKDAAAAESLGHEQKGGFHGDRRRMRTRFRTAQDGSEVDEHVSHTERPPAAKQTKASTMRCLQSRGRRRRIYNKYTQAQKRQIAEYSNKYGAYAAARVFSRTLGCDIPPASVAYIRSKYNREKVENLTEENIFKDRLPETFKGKYSNEEHKYLMADDAESNENDDSTSASYYYASGLGVYSADSENPKGGSEDNDGEVFHQKRDCDHIKMDESESDEDDDLICTGFSYVVDN